MGLDIAMSDYLKGIVIMATPSNNKRSSVGVQITFALPEAAKVCNGENAPFQLHEWPHVQAKFLNLVRQWSQIFQ